MFFKYKEFYKTLLFHLILNVVFALFITVSSYYNTPLTSLTDRLAYLMHLCIVQATLAGFLYFLSLNRYLFKFFFPILFIGLGLVSFWVFTIDISMSATLIEACLNSKFYIVKDLITIQLVLFIVLLFILTYLIIRFYNTIQNTIGFVILIPISIGLIFCFFYINNIRDRTLSSKMPYAFFNAFNEYFKSANLVLKEPNTNLKTSLTSNLKVILVVGESVRADHLGINGYHRPTTPLLLKRENLVSFDKIYTNKTITIKSLPQLLTSQGINDSKDDSATVLFSVLNNNDIPTTWTGNQLLESAYRPIVNMNNKVTIIDQLKSYNSFSKKKDMELIPYFKKNLKNLNSGLFSLHMIGSHWWYEDKYTNEFRKFTPVVDSKFIPSLSKEQMINSYDNTIVYLDYFLNDVILELEKETVPTILIYCSDHGETLGENGKWLHSDFNSLTNPAMLVWYSNSFKEKYTFKINVLNSLKEQFLTTDVIYHSILDLFEINEFNKDQSIFYCEE